MVQNKTSPSLCSRSNQLFPSDIPNLCSLLANAKGFALLSWLLNVYLYPSRRPIILVVRQVNPTTRLTCSMMVPSSFSTYVTLFLVYSRSVQAVDETVWSAFAYVLNGERTPLHGPGTAQGRLTSLGAQQMLSQGSLLRTRWLTNGTSAGKDTNATTIAPIANIEKRAIDNDQLSIYSSRDDHVTAGALAFMQGLYPPQTQTFAVNNGGINASVLANGSLVDFPLDGYMYPNIQTLSLSDSESVW